MPTLLQILLAIASSAAIVWIGGAGLFLLLRFVSGLLGGDTDTYLWTLAY